MSKNDKFIPHYALPHLFSKDKHVNEKPSIYKEPEVLPRRFTKDECSKFDLDYFTDTSSVKYI
jgi:hypothetical protein